MISYKNIGTFEIDTGNNFIVYDIFEYKNRYMVCNIYYNGIQEIDELSVELDDYINQDEALIALYDLCNNNAFQTTL